MYNCFKYCVIKDLLVTSMAILLMTQSLVAQEIATTHKWDNKLLLAKDYFLATDYEKAVELYVEVFNIAGYDTALIIKIADCCRLLNDTKNAEAYYRKIIPENQYSIDPYYLLYFGQVLTANSKYDEAYYWFEQYLKLRPDDQLAMTNIRSLRNIASFYVDTSFYVVHPVEINTQYSELCPIYYKEKIFFLTNCYSKNKEFMEWYTSGIDSSGKLLAPVKYPEYFKTLFNEGPAVFYAKDSKMIFTQNYIRNKQSKQPFDIPLKLYAANLDSTNNWRPPQLLPFQENDHSYSQPSITANGEVLYFSSDLPGGFGGYDLYRTTYSCGQWSKPENLGHKINTAGDESFPCIYNDSTLYFSSNGHGGLGLLDIFKVNPNSGTHIENLGAPFNSSLDDFGIILDSTGNKGYFTSNRQNGKANDNIFYFKKIRTSKSIDIVDEYTNEPIEDAKIYISGNDSIPAGITNRQGRDTLILPMDKIVQLNIKKENYLPKVFILQKKPTHVQSNYIITLQSIKQDHIILTDLNDNCIENPRDVIYKVQIYASHKPAHKRELKRKYNGKSKIENVFEDNWNKYLIGAFDSYRNARLCVEKIQVSDAFVVAYINNQRANIIIAKAKTNETHVPSPIKKNNH